MSDDVQKLLIQNLKELCAHLPDLRRIAPDAVYQNKEDLLLRHGQFYLPQALPKGYRRRKARACFGNAFSLSMKAGLHYAEGVALASADTGGFPIHHAWCLDADGRVVDPTWREPGITYFGVVFSFERVVHSQSTANQSVLDDWPHRWPALREPYTPQAVERRRKR